MIIIILPNAARQGFLPSSCLPSLPFSSLVKRVSVIRQCRETEALLKVSQVPRGIHTAASEDPPQMAKRRLSVTTEHLQSSSWVKMKVLRRELSLGSTGYKDRKTQGQGDWRTQGERSSLDSPPTQTLFILHVNRGKVKKYFAPLSEFSVLNLLFFLVMGYLPVISKLADRLRGYTIPFKSPNPLTFTLNWFRCQTHM